MICPRCNADISDKVVYCTECGIRVKPRKEKEPPNKIVLELIYTYCLIFSIFDLFLISTLYLIMGGIFIAIMGIIFIVINVIAMRTSVLLRTQKKDIDTLTIINCISSIIVSLPLNYLGVIWIFKGLTGNGDYDGLYLLFGLPHLFVGMILLVRSAILLKETDE